MKKIFITIPGFFNEDEINNREAWVRESTGLFVKINYYEWDRDNQTATVQVPAIHEQNIVEALRDYGDTECFTGEPEEILDEEGNFNGWKNSY
jgi:hypothetical protein